MRCILPIFAPFPFSFSSLYSFLFFPSRASGSGRLHGSNDMASLSPAASGERHTARANTVCQRHLLPQFFRQTPTNGLPERTNGREVSPGSTSGLSSLDGLPFCTFSAPSLAYTIAGSAPNSRGPLTLPSLPKKTLILANVHFDGMRRPQVLTCHTSFSEVAYLGAFF